jgi:hypothetical protein
MATNPAGTVGDVGGRAWPRSFDAENLLERFFVAGAATFVGTRAYLALTGYPQIGGHGLHIAHLLWGGLLMTVSLVLGFAFLGRTLRGWLAIAGGAGFGLFVDELGKLITTDVDYFYRPALPLIYAVFVVLFLACQAIVDRARASPRTALAQALEVIQSGVLRGMAAADRDRALALLREAAPTEPLAATLLAGLPSATVASREPGRFGKAAAAWYGRAVHARWFVPAIVVMAAAQAATNLAEVASEIARDPTFRPGAPAIGPVDAAKAAASALSAGLVVVGLVNLPRSRPAALEWIKRGLLTALLLAQPLAFYAAQVLALWGLGFHLVLLVGVAFAIRRELGSAGETRPSPAADAVAAAA